MPEYLHPGVFVEEVSSGVRPIEGVGTSTAGFVGVTAKGVPNRATFITGWQQFVDNFGSYISNSFLPYAVSQFFSNGGKRAYVVRVLNAASAVSSARMVTDRETAGPARPTLEITARGAGGWGDGLAVQVDDGGASPSSEFRLTVLQDGLPQEIFDNLSMDPTALNYVETEVNGASTLITVRDQAARLAGAANATSTTTNPLAAPVAFAAAPGEDVTIELPDGRTNTVNFTGNVAPADVVTRLNGAWGPLNIGTSLDATNRLVVRHNAAGYDRYVNIPATGAAAVGRPLAGLAFAQGAGPAIGGTVKSAVGTTFNTGGGNNVLTIAIHAPATPGNTITATLPIGAAVAIDDIRSAIDAALTANARGLARVSREGDRLVLSTTNRGSQNAAIVVAGTADAVLQFRRFDRGGATGDTINGVGRSEPAFLQSVAGPFTLQDNSNFRIIANSGNLGADTTITVTFTTANIPNLQSATAPEVAAVITAAGGATLSAAAVNNRVVITSGRRGNAYTLRVIDGLNRPNVRLLFDTTPQAGAAQGDAGSPYYRPALNLDASGVNIPWELTGGDDGAPVSNFDYVGTADLKNGLHAFDDVKDVNFVAVPGNFDTGVVSAAVGYCSNRRDCFYIVDPPGRVTRDTPITDPAEIRDFTQNRITTKTSYGALYYPWLEVSDPVGAGRNPTRFIPPSGFIAGLYARTDNLRGVWKAPAGTEASLFGVISLDYSVTDSEQDILNPVGVNCIRQFPGAGIVSWGARTLATQSDPEWRYVPVRRYAIYLEQSILRGTQWAVFEPNDETLWESLRTNIEDFLMGEFRRGALAGATPDEAFAVKCDADLNSPSEVNAGRVNVEVKFAPLKPAEFVIIRISQKLLRPQG